MALYSVILLACVERIDALLAEYNEKNRPNHRRCGGHSCFSPLMLPPYIWYNLWLDVFSHLQKYGCSSIRSEQKLRSNYPFFGKCNRGINTFDAEK